MANVNQTDFFLFININSSTLPLSYYDNQTDSYTSPSGDQTANNFQSLEFFERLTILITLIVSIIGLIGNVFTIIVLNRRSMRKWRSSMLLSALAVVDFLYLLIIFLAILDELTNKSIGLNRSLILCQSTVYITHVCSFLSAGFTLSFTLQRFVAVLFPLHANTIISSRSSIINILLLLFFGFSFYSFSFFVTNLSQGQCREDENYPALFPLLIVDTCLTFILPFICIVFCNCAIVYKLQQRKQCAGIFDGSLTVSMAGSRKQRRSSSNRLPGNDSYYERQRLYESNPNNNYVPIKNGTKTSNGLVSSHHKITTPHIESKTTGNGYSSRATAATISNELTPALSSNSNHNRQGISQRTTKMLVICSTTFLLFNSPYCAVLLYSIISKIVFTRTLSILRHFYFMSFCLNFFLYSLCGHRFRHELILLLKSCSRKCFTQNTREHWSRNDKIPQQSSFTHVTTKTNV